MARFTSDDGVAIAWHEWAADVDGTPVLLHHGFAADTMMNWVLSGIVAALVETGRRVIAIDARGHGESDKPHDEASYGEARMAQDVIGLLDHLGLESVDLVGYSLGGVVALVVAGREPRVRRLVVGGIGGAVAGLGGLRRSHLDGRGLSDALLTDRPQDITDERLAAFRKFADFTKADRAALAAQARAALRAPVPLDAVRAPATVIAGDADPLAAGADLLAQALGARFVLVPGDHLSVIGTPELTAAVVSGVG